MNQVLMGFLVAGTALGGSALKNVESHTTAMNGRALAPGYFVQQATNSYTYVSTMTADQGNCINEAASRCKYTVPAQNSIPSSGPYSESELQEFGLKPTNDLVLTFYPFNVTDIFTKMKMVFEGRELTEELISKGQQRLRHFSWLKASMQLKALFKAGVK